MRFIPNNEPVRQAMLREIGLPDIESLFASIPPEARMQGPLNLPPGLSEPEHLAEFAALAEKNAAAGQSVFLGAGSYPHFTPLLIDSLLQRGEFLTSYTPYQPEISQGTLQAIFEFQSFITYLTGMEVANASMYDGASATAEAVLMAERLNRGRSRVLLGAGLHPHYRQVVETHTRFLEMPVEPLTGDWNSGRTDMKALAEKLDEDVACLVVQQPNCCGVIEELVPLAEAAHGAGALLIVVVTEALSLALLEAPGRLGADIVVGEAQSFGSPVNYGGPYLGFMATRETHKRQLPGRIAGETTDAQGRRGYVLTLATREQHIRRERATSNICTNENLVMLGALIYLTLLGGEGLKAVARQNVSLMQYFLERLKEAPGFAPAFPSPCFNEVAVACPRPAAEVVARCAERGIVPGLDLGDWDPAMAAGLLVCVTETKTKAEIDALADALAEIGKEAAQ